MRKRGLALTLVGAAVLAGTPAPPAVGEEADPPPDPAVVAAREASAADPAQVDTNPPEVRALADGPSSSTRVADLYWLRGKSTAGGYVEVVARDNPAQDKPGLWSTTMRIYGNAAGFRSGLGKISLKSQFTCTGAGISGVSIGSDGVSVSGGATSTTLTWNSVRSNATEVRQFYTEGGHFRCKALNVAPAKTTRRATATANYKTVDTRAQDEYSFSW